MYACIYVLLSCVLHTFSLHVGLLSTNTKPSKLRRVIASVCIAIHSMLQKRRTFEENYFQENKTALSKETNQETAPIRLQ